MVYVCSELSSIDTESNLATCKQWSVLEQQTTNVIPELTSAERDVLLSWIISIFALVFVVKRLRRMYGS